VCVTPPAVTANEAELAPAATVMFAGGLNASVFVASATVAPPAGAALPRVTVHVPDEPPKIVAGAQTTESVPAG